MAIDGLDRLLSMVSMEELETLRDAILREEGRRQASTQILIHAPFPPLDPGDDRASVVTRWARLLAWLANDLDIPFAQSKRGVSLHITYAQEQPEPQVAGILLQEALVEAGLLLGRTPESMDATTTEITPGEIDAIQIELWEKPVPEQLWK